MKRNAFVLILALVSLSANAAMTEEQCKSQAKAVDHLLEMVESGSLPKNDEHVAKLEEAKKHIQKGEYCAARQIVLNLNN
ncbi:hypothetical protein GA069_15000 [Vibrio parahaemolyticus]|nr:hypothetical protein [Vibrio parahaemolyticus]